LAADVAKRLYEELGRRLQAFVFGLVSRADVAQEIVQTSFERLLRQGGGVQPESHRAWLYQVARNEALLWRRKRELEQRAGTALASQRVVDSDPVIAGLLQRDKIERVRLAVSQLPQAQRQVVELRLQEELTFAEIATRLGLPLGTVLSQMRSAIERLSRSLTTDN
jgi:RNA polymerase sigma factor (sigma-70 family)